MENHFISLIVFSLLINSTYKIGKVYANMIKLPKRY
jgi:hypothetical protein